MRELMPYAEWFNRVGVTFSSAEKRALLHQEARGPAPA